MDSFFCKKVFHLSVPVLRLYPKPFTKPNTVSIKIQTWNEETDVKTQKSAGDKSNGNVQKVERIQVERSATEL